MKKRTTSKLTRPENGNTSCNKIESSKENSSSNQITPKISPGRARLLQSVAEFKYISKIPSEEICDGKVQWESREGIWILPADMLIAIFKFLLPQDLQKVSQVCKAWNLLSSSNAVWEAFCSKYWENPEKLLWKEMYLLWIRRMAQKLKEIHIQNETLAQKFLEKKIRSFYPITFFWPSYAALRERYNFRILVVGDSSIGKTNLILRFSEDKFYPNNPESELKLRTIDISNHVVELHMLDSGSSYFSKSEAGTFLLSNACFICYDITNMHSFEQTKKWFAKLSNTNAFIVLVGTKADLEQKRVVSKAIGEQLAESKNVGFVEVSSKTGQNIENLFRSTAEKIFRNLAWPNYVPPESDFRKLVGLSEVEFGMTPTINDSLTLQGKNQSCIIQ